MLNIMAKRCFNRILLTVDCTLLACLLFVVGVARVWQ